MQYFSRARAKVFSGARGNEILGRAWMPNHTSNSRALTDGAIWHAAYVVRAILTQCAHIWSRRPCPRVTSNPPAAYQYVPGTIFWQPSLHLLDLIRGAVRRSMTPLNVPSWGGQETLTLYTRKVFLSKCYFKITLWGNTLQKHTTTALSIITTYSSSI